jgi:hypothetical protein
VRPGTGPHLPGPRWARPGTAILLVLRSHGPVRPLRCGIGAEHVSQRGPHGQDQDRQAGHDRGDGPWCPRRPGLGQQVVGHLSGHAECEGADRRPLSEPAGPAADRVLAAQPGTQRVRGVRLDADGQGDGRVQVQGRQDARQRRPGRTRSSARCRPSQTTPRPPPGRPGPAAARTARSWRRRRPRWTGPLQLVRWSGQRADHLAQDPRRRRGGSCPR